jgi:hypothetical protein
MDLNQAPEWIKEMFLEQEMLLSCIPDNFNCDTWKTTITKIGGDFAKQETANQYKTPDEKFSKGILTIPTDLDLTHLTDFGIPVDSPNAIECVLRSIVKISDCQPDPKSDVKPNADVLRLPHLNGKGHCNHLIVVKPCSRLVFKRNVNLWVQRTVQTCAKHGEMDTRSVLL